MEDQDRKGRAASFVSISDEPATQEIVADVVGGLWEAVNELTRLRPSKRERYQVSIFGSARIERGTAHYDAVRDLARALAEMDCNIITGGGPGMMQAANEGASEVDTGQLNRSVGIRIDLPFEQDANPFVQRAFEHKTFFTRLHHFVLASDAFVVAPGGIGTVLEAMLVWQLLQVRHVENVPLIFLGTMWNELVNWGRTYMLRDDLELASPEDFDIPLCVNTVDEAIAAVSAAQQKWQSR